MFDSWRDCLLICAGFWFPSLFAAFPGFARFSVLRYVPSSRGAHFSLLCSVLAVGVSPNQLSSLRPSQRGLSLSDRDISRFGSPGCVYGSLFSWYGCSRSVCSYRWRPFSVLRVYPVVFCWAAVVWAGGRGVLLFVVRLLFNFRGFCNVGRACFVVGFWFIREIYILLFELISDVFLHF